MTRYPRHKQNPFNKKTRTYSKRTDHAKWSRFLEHVQKEHGSLRAFDDHFAELVKGANNVLVHKQPLSQARNETKLLDVNINREILVVSNHIWEEILRELYKSPNKLKTIDRRAFEELWLSYLTILDMKLN